MRVFLSWSGVASRQIAEILYTWIPKVLQAIDPFLSSQDIEKGERWLSSISTNLENIDVGIVVMTKANVSSPWINFEAGALSKKIDRSRIIPVLFEITDTDLVGHPLAQFQYVKLEKDDLSRLFRMLNASCSKPLSETQFEETFALWFDKHFELLKKIKPSIQSKKANDATDEPVNTEGRLGRIESAIDEILNFQRRSKASIDRVEALGDYGKTRFELRVNAGKGTFSANQARRIRDHLQKLLPSANVVTLSPRQIAVQCSELPSISVVQSAIERLEDVPDALQYEVQVMN